jgi:hypothetical protein
MGPRLRRLGSRRDRFPALPGWADLAVGPPGLGDSRDSLCLRVLTQTLGPILVPALPGWPFGAFHLAPEPAKAPNGQSAWLYSDVLSFVPLHLPGKEVAHPPGGPKLN